MFRNHTNTCAENQKIYGTKFGISGGADPKNKEVQLHLQQSISCTNQLNFLTARQFNPARYFRTNFAALCSTRGKMPRTVKIPLYNAKTFKSTCSLNADVIRLTPPPIGERTIVIIYTAPKCQKSQ